MKFAITFPTIEPISRGEFPSRDTRAAVSPLSLAQVSGSAKQQIGVSTSEHWKAKGFAHPSSFWQQTEESPS